MAVPDRSLLSFLTFFRTEGGRASPPRRAAARFASPAHPGTAAAKGTSPGTGASAFPEGESAASPSVPSPADVPSGPTAAAYGPGAPARVPSSPSCLNPHAAPRRHPPAFQNRHARVFSRGRLGTSPSPSPSPSPRLRFASGTVPASNGDGRAAPPVQSRWAPRGAGLGSRGAPAPRPPPWRRAPSFCPRDGRQCPRDHHPRAPRSPRWPRSARACAAPRAPPPGARGDALSAPPPPPRRRRLFRRPFRRAPLPARAPASSARAPACTPARPRGAMRRPRGPPRGSHPPSGRSRLCPGRFSSASLSWPCRIRHRGARGHPRRRREGGAGGGGGGHGCARLSTKSRHRRFCGVVRTRARSRRERHPPADRGGIRCRRDPRLRSGRGGGGAHWGGGGWCAPDGGGRESGTPEKDWKCCWCGGCRAPHGWPGTLPQVGGGAPHPGACIGPRRYAVRGANHHGRRHPVRGHHPSIRHEVHHLVPGRGCPRGTLGGGWTHRAARQEY